MDLVQKDLKETEIELTEDNIKEIPKIQWKKYVILKVEIVALKYLSSQNNEKTKTKHIKFSSFQMSDYLSRNESTTLSKTIFSVRSGTLDLKVWNS